MFPQFGLALFHPWNFPLCERIQLISELTDARGHGWRLPVTSLKAELNVRHLHLQRTSFAQSQGHRGSGVAPRSPSASVSEAVNHQIPQIKTIKRPFQPAPGGFPQGPGSEYASVRFCHGSNLCCGRSFIRPFITSYPGKWQVPEPGPGLVSQVVLDSSAYLQRSIPLMQIQIRSPS